MFYIVDNAELSVTHNSYNLVLLYILVFSYLYLIFNHSLILLHFFITSGGKGISSVLSSVRFLIRLTSVPSKVTTTPFTKQ